MKWGELYSTEENTGKNILVFHTSMRRRVPSIYGTLKFYGRITRPGGSIPMLIKDGRMHAFSSWCEVYLSGDKMKAIVITADNRNMLAARYQIDQEDFDDVLPLGYSLVTDFANEDTFDTVTPANLEARFTKTGVTLENGFEVVVLK